MPERAEAIVKLAESMAALPEALERFNQGIERLATSEELERKVAEAKVEVKEESRRRRNIAVAAVVAVVAVFFGLMFNYVRETRNDFNSVTSDAAMEQQQALILGLQFAIDCSNKANLQAYATWRSIQEGTTPPVLFDLTECATVLTLLEQYNPPSLGEAPPTTEGEQASAGPDLSNMSPDAVEEFTKPAVDSSPPSTAAGTTTTATDDGPPISAEVCVEVEDIVTVC